MPEIIDEYMEQLEEERPSVVVVAVYDSNIQKFLDNNKYEKVWPGDNGEEAVDYSNVRWVYYRAQQ